MLCPTLIDIFSRQIQHNAWWYTVYCSVCDLLLDTTSHDALWETISAPYRLEYKKNALNIRTALQNGELNTQ